MKVDVREIKEVYRGFFRLFRVLLRYRRFDGSMSQEVALEALERGEGVAVVLYDPKVEVVGLVRQFRIGPHLRENQGWVAELVAGACDGETDYAAVAQREVKEETGWSLQYLKPVQTFYVSPSGTTERIHLFVGLFDSHSAPSMGGLEAEGEDVQAFTVPFAKAIDMITTGEINSATATLGLQWLQMNRQQFHENENTQA